MGWSFCAILALRRLSLFTGEQRFTWRLLPLSYLGTRNPNVVGCQWHHTLLFMEDSVTTKHLLPPPFSQALNEERVQLFDVFIHPEFNNRKAYLEPGPAGAASVRNPEGQ
jgi:hypothetical protein